MSDETARHEKSTALFTKKQDSWQSSYWWNSPGLRAARRSIGLNFTSFFPYTGKEEPRVILDKSFMKALARCTVHILPILCEIVLIWTNTYGVLYGDATAFRLATMQVAAKTMELLAVGSLATIVWHVIRSSLLHASGVPFGLLGAGINFTQINWFWSPAFLFSMRPVSWRHGFAVMTVLACGGLALAMNPATAVLLVPIEFDDWPGGGTKFWMNGTIDSLWPKHLTLQHIGGPHCQNPDPSAMMSDHYGEHTACVWDCYPILKNYFQFVAGTGLNSITLADFLPFRSSQGQLRGSPSPGWDPDLQGEACETFTYAPHLAETTMSRGLEDLWHGVVNTDIQSFRRSALRYAYPWKTLVPTNISAVRARCNLVAIDDIDATYAFKFPALPEYGYFNKSYWTWRGTLSGSPVNSNETLTRWINLHDASPPEESSSQTPPSAAVLISLGAYSSFHDISTLYVLPCSVDARWTAGHNIRIGTLQQREAHYAEPLHTVKRGGCLNPFPPVSDGTWKHITFAQDFLSWLSPSLDGGPSSVDVFKRTTLADILNSSVGVSFQAAYTDLFDTAAIPAEMIVAHFFAQALSYVGLYDNAELSDLTCPTDYSDRGIQSAILNGGTATKRVPFKSSVESTWQIRNTGFALKATSITDWLAIAVLCVHIILALTHVIYMLISRETSDSWDATDELLALIWNSEPRRGAPKNTSCGINDRHTFSSQVSIRVVDPMPNEATEIVQLVATSMASGSTQVEMNVAYGAKVQ